ncbi:ABC transporter substrate-binding protein [Streptomyces achromogenes]|uniref:ABC transporter substrate-binding protein n=1 Tax=Streptomyces achromogenes TaxID=67255 RepID=UPI0036F6505F
MPEEGTTFVEAFKAAVRPEPRRTHRTERQGALPVVVLCGDGGAGGDPESAAVSISNLAAYVFPDDAHRGARHALIEPGHLADGADAAVREVIRQLASAELNGVGRLRLPEVALLKSLADWNPDTGRDGDKEPALRLRDYAYERLCDRHKGLMALRWLAGGQQPDLSAGRGLRDFLFILLPVPLFYFLPRWLWTLRCDRRLLRQAKRHPWWAFARGREAHPESGRFFDTAIAWRAGPHGDGGHRMERALWAALLSDLRHANRPGRLRPYRRRRRTRCVVLLSPPADDRRREVFDRFLTAYEDACGVIPYASVVLVAGMRGEGTKSLAEVATQWRPQRTRERQLARLSEALPEHGTGVPPLPVPYFRPVARADGELAVELTALAAALAVTAWLVVTGVPSRGHSSTPCLGGNENSATSAPPVPASPASPEEYARARDMIKEENRRVDKQAPAGHVRTVFYLGANRGNTRFGSGLPELRGIAMGQREANRAAQSDLKHGIWLKVDALDAGARFARAADMARKIVAKAAENRDIIGVVGFSESRTESRKAISVLTAARIPVIVSTSTANAMLPGHNAEFVHRVSPVNSRETDVEAAFVQYGAIVRDDSGDCHTARAAVVVRDPSDLYSNELGEQFGEKFEKLTRVRPFTVAYGTNAAATAPPDSGVVTDDISRVAQAVCTRLHKDDRTLLYWAARAEDFGSFLHEFGEGTTCSGRHLTVLGGNELTNAALAGEFSGDDRLSLYHTAHALPMGDERRTQTAKNFSEEYAATWKNDLWRNDGHAAQGRDAVTLMAKAASTVSTGGQTVTSELVQNTLYNGGETINRVGASGALRYVPGVPDPQNKPVIILRHFDKGNPVPVLVCGAFTLTPEDDYTRWGPDQQYECPTDQ